jgi:hypothetical protein
MPSDSALYQSTQSRLAMKRLSPQKLSGKGTERLVSNIDEAEAADDNLGDSDNDFTPVYSE